MNLLFNITSKDKSPEHFIVDGELATPGDIQVILLADYAITLTDEELFNLIITDTGKGSRQTDSGDTEEVTITMVETDLDPED
ncbi:hypothetical protein PR1_86 [Providencia phage vB_PreS_PR1]|uniref:Uncharacterized protein n=1 Tax=Providencia phage vB_PreS_PR1 TaxID=1931407 RepID=A0A1S6KV91_9CAUD|nr:hypothetical protein FDH30_gp129 [Providencia phage vB_PreS_PR1]AQT25335.1 hypothetical protein PR1_86 [Providencia phage vB_PreS_PR1]